MKNRFTKTIALLSLLFVFSGQQANSLINSPFVFTMEKLELHAVSADMQVDISWTSENERSNSVFSLERSSNGVDWETIATVKGKGAQGQEVSYEEVDKAPYSGQSYYRVKQSNDQGWFRFSKIVVTEVEKPLAQIMLFPNPAVSSIKVSAGSEVETLRVNICNYRGLTVRDLTVANGEVIDVSQLPAGVYVVNVQCENEVFRQSFIKSDLGL